MYSSQNGCAIGRGPFRLDHKNLFVKFDFAADFMVLGIGTQAGHGNLAHSDAGSGSKVRARTVAKGSHL
jgi:hypothetical protein